MAMMKKIPRGMMSQPATAAQAGVTRSAASAGKSAASTASMPRMPRKRP